MLACFNGLLFEIVTAFPGRLEAVRVFKFLEEKDDHFNENNILIRIKKQVCPRM
jgi:hypothetical protein|tara:strand:- start:738 stop:899 length:162 start_codon:yes stop_codon:yes gene_type:complete